MSERLESILNDKALEREIKRKLGRQGPRQGVFEAGTDLRGAIARNAGLEKIIEIIGRPSYLVQHDAIAVPATDVWGLRLAGCRDDLHRAIRATARVEITDSSGSWYEGTAWLIAPGLAITNRHVAMAFVKRNPDGTGTIRKDFKKKTMRVVLDFLEEHETDDTFEVEVDVEVPFIADDDETVADIALLKLKESARKLPEPIPLAAATPSPGQATWVAAIGYPALDPDEDPKVRADIFNDIFEVKRVSPGMVMATPAGEWFFTHDCSTFGGNSGSVLLDVQSGGAAGLHFKGFARQANYAVRAEEIRRLIDPVLKRLGVELPAPVTAAREAVLESLTTLPEGGDEGTSTRSASALASREGYLEDFLGSDAFVIPHPTLVRSRANDGVLLKDGGGTILRYTHFSLEVSSTRGLPLWTAVNIEPGKREKVSRPGWINDPRIEAEAQVGDWFYKKAKLSRGHMVRRLDPVWGDDWKQGNDDTHVFTNACPQVQSFNDGIWGDLEDYALYDRAADRKITVLTGPILDHADPELFEVQVPVRFWKIIAFRKNNALTAAAFVLGQEKELESSQWAPFQWTIAALEKEIDIDFGPLRSVDPEGAVEGPARRRRIYGPEDVRF